MRNGLEELRHFFRQGLPSKINALKSVQQELGQPGSQTYASVKRIAHALRVSGEEYGYPEIAKKAQELESADDLEISAKLEELLHVLRDISNHEEEQKFKILVIEDSPDTAQLIALTLKAPNREIFMAETCELAREILDEHDVSLILLDLFLPDTDGRNLLIELRERPKTASVPIFVISGQIGSQAESECYALGADEFIRKPFDLKLLSGAVSSKLQRAVDIKQKPKIDLLTGLPSRVVFKQKYNEELGKAIRMSTSFSIGLVNLDHHETLKKKLGEEFGNQSMLLAANILKNHMGENDTVARWDGAAFAVLFPDTQPKQAKRKLEEGLQSLRENPLDVSKGDPVPITFSAGVVSVSQGLAIKDVMEQADALLFHAKAHGRNRVFSSCDDVETIPKKILLLEDDETTSLLIEHRLKRSNFEVMVFEDGRTAYEAICQESVSLAILDANVPVMSGFELLSRIRNIPAYMDMPIIMLTCMGSEKDIQRGFDLGANDYILKPFSPMELMARVHRLLKNT